MSRVSVSAMKRGHAASSSEKALIKKCALYTLEAEGIENRCYIAVHTTDNNGIKELNLEYRSIGRETDVLSFPMLDLVPGEQLELSPGNTDPETGLIQLGDIVISLEMAKLQAAEYSHSVERELGFLVVHSVLHLLGYDHETDVESERKMRAREERILSDLGLKRE